MLLDKGAGFERSEKTEDLSIRPNKSPPLAYRRGTLFIKRDLSLFFGGVVK